MTNSLTEYNLEITKKSIAIMLLNGHSFRQVAMIINEYDNDARIDLMVSAMSACKELGKEL